MSTEEPWRLWILLSAVRGQLGREERYGWATLDAVKEYAGLRLPHLDLEARNESTGERWQRVRRTWSRIGNAQPQPPPARPVAEPAISRERMYWLDKD